MNKKIKVYLQYPWKFPDSPYYKYLIDAPPEGIEFLNVRKQKGVITNNRFFVFSNILKKNIRKAAKFLAPSLPNAHLSPKGNYELIHCAHCLSRNKDKSWVADIEYASQMWVAGSTPKNKKNARKLLLSKNCKKIISWTKLMEKELLQKFPEIKDKLEVVYPGVPVLSDKRKKHKGIVLSFVARYFYKKGGLHALEVMDLLTKKYENVSGIIVAEVPEEVKRMFSKNKKIQFKGLMNQRKLIEDVYSITDIFVYPGYSDSFGFAIPEVMGMGIPVVSVNGSSRKEIISDNENGFVIDTSLNQRELVRISSELKSEETKRLIAKMVEKTESLILDRKLLLKFSKNAKNEIKNGKFSIARQKREIGRIYGEALE